MDTDLVLGVAISPTAIGLVLMRWRRTDGQIVDSDRIDTTPPRAGHAEGAVADRAKDAVLRTYATTVTHGYRIPAVGVTGVNAAVAEAGEVLRLTDLLKRAGCPNVVTVGSQTADSTGAAPSAAAIAAAHAASVVRDPAEHTRFRRDGRQDGAEPDTPRRLLLGAVAASALAVVASLTALNATSADRPAAPSPTPTRVAVPVMISPAPARTTQRPVFVDVKVEPRRQAPEIPVVEQLPTAAPLAPTSAPEAPAPAPEAPASPTPPPDASVHLPGSADEPRLPGPA